MATRRTCLRLAASASKGRISPVTVAPPIMPRVWSTNRRRVTFCGITHPLADANQQTSLGPMSMPLRGLNHVHKEQKQYHPLVRRVKNSISLNLRYIALHLRYRLEEWEAYKIVFFIARREQFCARTRQIPASHMPVARTTLSGYACHAVRIPPPHVHYARHQPASSSLSQAGENQAWQLVRQRYPLLGHTSFQRFGNCPHSQSI